MDWSVINTVSDWFTVLLHNTWNWFNSLTYQEWFLLLGIVASLGFLCMRGYGARGNL